MKNEENKLQIDINDVRESRVEESHGFFGCRSGVLVSENRKSRPPVPILNNFLNKNAKIL